MMSLDLPRNASDGRLAGFCFVQFSRKGAAVRAIRAMHAHRLLGRVVTVEFAVTKDAFGDKKGVVPKEPKEEEEAADDDADEEAESMFSARIPCTYVDTDLVSLPLVSTAPANGKKKRFAEPEANTTLFIRNVSFETSQDDLTEALEEYGVVNYCRLVMDRSTGQPRGSAFVQYAELEGAEALLKAAGGQTGSSGSVDVIEARLEAERSGGGVTVDERTLVVTRAVDRKSASTLSVAGIKGAERTADKRNLKMASEGTILSADHPDANGMSLADLERRQGTEEAKRTALKNPNFHVSTNRLCIHNLPLSMTDAKLRDVAIDAINAKRSIVKQSKVIRNESGSKRSKRFGFVEFKSAEDALKCLRALNNNPKTFSDKARPIVEFALENAVAIRKLKARANKQDEDRKSRIAEEGGGAKKRRVDSDGKMNRGARQRESRRERALESEEKQRVAVAPVVADVAANKLRSSRYRAEKQEERDLEVATARAYGVQAAPKKGSKKRERAELKVIKKRMAKKPAAAAPKKKGKNTGGVGDDRKDHFDGLVSSYQARFFKGKK